MSLFSDARAALKDELVPVIGIPVHTGWPDRVSPPFAFMLPPIGESYVRWGPHFGKEVTLAMDLVLVVDHGDANTSMVEVEELIDVVLHHVNTWVVHEVESPEPTNVAESGAEYLAAVIHLTKAVRTQ